MELSSKEVVKFHQIIECYQQLMYTNAYSILRNHHEAEDAVQDSLIIIIKHICQIKDVMSGETAGYINKIVRNRALSIYKRNRRGGILQRVEEVADFLVDTNVVSPDQNAVISDEIRRISHGFKMLNRCYRQMLLMYFVSEMSVKEISSKLKMKERTVRRHLVKAKELLLKSVSPG